MAEKKPRSYSAPALEKGFDILELLAEIKKPLSLAQISVELSRSKSEIYRMLAVLEEKGYLLRDEGTDNYRISNKLFDLGMSVPPFGTLVEAAFPLMHQLAERISQSCHLAVASGNRMVVVARVESPGNIGLSVRVGHHLKLYQSGSGEVLLAWMEQSKREQLYEQYLADESFNSDTLEKELEKVRRNGCIKRKSFIAVGVEDLSCPVFMGDHRHVVAALSVPYLKSPNKDIIPPAQCLEEMKIVAEELSGLCSSFGGF